MDVAFSIGVCVCVSKKYSSIEQVPVKVLLQKILQKVLQASAKIAILLEAPGSRKIIRSPLCLCFRLLF